MDKRILDHLQREGMVSLMNSTKWRELAFALKGIKEGGPKVRLKYLLDEEPCPGFAHLDWEWVKHGETSVIEWLEIDPIYRTFKGKLIPAKEENLSGAMAAALKAVGVPFSIEGQLFKVWGHVKAGAQPAFV